MRPTNQNPQRFSTIIHMHLKTKAQTFTIAQLGPDFLILQDPTDQPPGEAEITMTIDGREKRWTVYLPDGIRATDDGRVRTAVI